MSKILRQYWIHFFIWSIMIVYLMISIPLHTLFLIKDGKPIKVDEELPAETNQIKYSIGGLDASDEQLSIYNLHGWAFQTYDKNIPLDKFQRDIVLISNKRNYIFPTKSVSRPGVHQTFIDLGMDLNLSGFSAFIFKDAIENDRYCIGIIFRHLSSGSAFFINTAKTLLRTPNFLELEKGKSDTWCASLSKYNE